MYIYITHPPIRLVLCNKTYYDSCVHILIPGNGHIQQPKNKTSMIKQPQNQTSNNPMHSPRHASTPTSSASAPPSPPCHSRHPLPPSKKGVLRAEKCALREPLHYPDRPADVVRSAHTNRKEGGGGVMRGRGRGRGGRGGLGGETHRLTDIKWMDA